MKKTRMHTEFRWQNLFESKYLEAKDIKRYQSILRLFNDTVSTAEVI
jgi:hypothetical protein